MKKLIASICFLISIPLVTKAQSLTEKRAEKFFNRLAYVKAAELYQRAAKQKSNDRVYERLGDCYRLMGRPGQSETWYGKVAQGASPSPASLLYYAEALRANGKYAESQMWISKYYAVKDGDTRAKQYASAADDHYEKLTAQQPYFSIRSLEVNTVQADFGAAFFQDKIVFASSRIDKVSVQNVHTWNNMPFLNLYVSPRDKEGNLGSASTLNKRINSRYHEGPSCFSADGNTLYFTRNNYFNKKFGKDSKGVNNLKIFRATQAGGSWKEENLSINSDEFSVGHPALSPDGRYLYFASDMPGGKGMTDIYRAEIKADGTLGAPENLGEGINTEGKEMFPFIDANGNLFFASDGQLGLGGLDVFYAPSNAQNGFGKAINPGAPVNSRADDFALVLDASGQSGYLSSNREGGKGDDDLYAITSLRPLKKTYFVKGIAKDKASSAALPGATITLQDADGNIQTASSDANGNYQFEIEPGKNYSIVASAKDYFELRASAALSASSDATELPKDLLLEKDPGLSLYLLVKEKNSSTPLEGVKLTITDNMNGQQLGHFTTAASGDWRNPLPGKKLGERVSYQIRLEKDGYLAKTVTYNASIEKAGPLNVHETLDISLDKIAVGLDLAKIIDIKPIYFDLGKSNIRKDAAAELDKIVKVMNENPAMVIELGSHTDCRSSAQSNTTLSDKRAKASAEYIRKKISKPERIYGKGYGETQLLNGCACEGAVKSTCPEEEHQKNRRTEFKVIKM